MMIISPSKYHSLSYLKSVQANNYRFGKNEYCKEEVDALIIQKQQKIVDELLNATGIDFNNIPVIPVLQLCDDLINWFDTSEVDGIWRSPGEMRTRVENFSIRLRGMSP